MHVKVRSKIIGGLVVLLAAVLAACGGPSPSVSLTLSSSSATVLRGQSVTVDVTLARSGGASADVLLSADVPASSGVTVTFAPSTLTGSIVTSTLTIDVGTAAADGPVTITVSADGSGVAATQTFTLTVGGPSPSVSLTLSNSSATVLRGQSVTVDVTLARSGGASADVLLSADVPASSGVTATLAPSTLTGSIVTSTLTIDVGAAAADGPVTITVSADGSGVAASQPFTLTVDSLTVNGSVVGLFGTLMPGATVASQGESTVTAADGSFQLNSLASPYDLTVSNTAEEWAHVFEGMTAPDPVLMPVIATMRGLTLSRTATLSGTLTGGMVPLAAGHALLVCAEGISFPVVGSCKPLLVGDATYSVNVSWSGPASAPVRVHALEYAVDTIGQPTSYGGYGVVETTLTDGGTVTKDVALGAGPATTTFSGTVVAPMGVTPTMALASVRISPNLSIPIAEIDPSAAFSLLMPDLPGATFDSVVAAGTGSGGQSFAWNVDMTGASGPLTLPLPAVRVSPGLGSVGVTVATPFEASNLAGGVVTFFWLPTGTGPTLAVTTTSVTATIPDVPGASLPSGADYNWSVLTYTGSATVDEGSQAYLADYAAAYAVGVSGGPGAARSGSLAASSAVATFTTAP